MTAADHITFSFDDEGRILYATYLPVDGPTTVSGPELRNLLGLMGFGDLAFLDDGLARLEAACRVGADSVTLAVAEKQDARIGLAVTDDGMSAIISVSKPKGGRPCDRPMLFEALYDSAIVFGVIQDVVDKILTTGGADNLVIARGQAPLRGESARFEPLIDTNVQRGKPRQRDDGSVDFFDLGTVTSVEKSQALLRKVPPTNGVPGHTVRGDLVAAEPGRDASWGPLGPSVTIDPNNSNEVIAVIAGQPRLGPTWAKVEPVIELKDVDLSTGNIHFDGNVVIHGMVQAGLSIWAGGDVIVNGIVEAAMIEAQGNIELRGGVVGHGTAKIKAKGTITARFVESAHIESGDSVFVSDLIMHSEVTALNRVEVAGGTKSQIVGGVIRAAHLIKARVIGSPASVQTRVEVGVNPYMKTQLEQLTGELALKRRKLDETSKALIHLKLHPRDGQQGHVRQLERTREQLLAETLQLTEQQNHITAMLEVAQNCKVIATDKLYSNVKIKISDMQRSIEEDTGGCSFRLRDGEILVGPV
ncbi:MAG: DUF342 domain-containing protein [Candidatus Sericytochromatia bacterium]|nr:DUF342 domain-containing protein [Candidatus Sericytochromatia bacterium]